MANKKNTNYQDRNIIDKYCKKTLAAVYINYPALLKTVGNIKNKKLLDLGCGSGYLSHVLSKKGANVSAVDNSQTWIKICKAQNIESKRLKFSLSDGSNLAIFKNEIFDIIIANMVFLNISSKLKLKKIFKEASRVIKKGGTFIFSDCHPLVKVCFKANTRIGGPLANFSYFNEGSKHKLLCLLSDYSKIEFIDSHWSIRFYSELLKKNGFVIEEIHEPKPFKMDPRKKLRNYKFPEYIIFVCKKVTTFQRTK